MNSLGRLLTVLVGCTAFCNVMDGRRVSVLTVERLGGGACEDPLLSVVIFSGQKSEVNDWYL